MFKGTNVRVKKQSKHSRKKRLKREDGVAEWEKSIRVG